MSFTVEEIANLYGISKEKVREKLKSMNKNVDSDKVNMSQSDLETNFGKPDSRRSEVVEKAKKRNVAVKEVVIGKAGDAAGARKPLLSKEEVEQRRKDAEQRRLKVKHVEEKATEANETHSANTVSSQPQESSQSSFAVGQKSESASHSEQKQHATTSEHNTQPRHDNQRHENYREHRNENDRPSRPQGDRPHYDRSNNDRGDRQGGNRYQGQGDNRSQHSGNRYQGQGDNRSQHGENRYQGQGDNRSQHGENRYQGQGDNRSQHGENRYQQGDRQNQDRQQGQGGGYYRGDRNNDNRGDRAPYAGNRPSGGGNREGGSRPDYNNRGPRPAGSYDSNRSGGTGGAGGGYSRDRGGYAGNRPSGGGFDKGGDRGGFAGRSGGGTGAPRSKAPDMSSGFGQAFTALSSKDEFTARVIKKKLSHVERSDDQTPKKSPHVGKRGTVEHDDWTRDLDEKLDELNISKEVDNELIAGLEAEIAPNTSLAGDGKSFHFTPTHRHKGRKDKKRVQKEVVIVRPSRIEIGDLVSVADLAHKMGIKSGEIIKKLMGLGVMATLNQMIDSDTATLVAGEYGIEIGVSTVREEDLLPSAEDNPADLVHRPPIVTIMGHVDHGKTSLLDYIRKAKVASGEAGGITQHIGAYEVIHKENTITFLDTPGHEAFTSLRARGANVTDIVILVVAADDVLMPQAKEAIDHAKAAGVRIVVAINKIDKQDAKPDVVTQQLAEYGIIPEAWGGENQFQHISAKTGQGIDELLELLLLEAEMLELKGNPKRDAECIVVETRLDKQKGAIATVLVQKGTLHKGDIFVCGDGIGRVRAMFNYRGVSLHEASLSAPVELMGFGTPPHSGDKVIVVQDEKLARQVVEVREIARRKRELVSRSKITLDDLFNKMKEGKLDELKIVLKTDVQGSLEALKASLLKLSNSEVRVNIIRADVGGISESDVVLASASDALIIGFNVRPDNNAKMIAEREGVKINLYSIIYQAIDDVKNALEGMLDPVLSEEVIGNVQIRQIFNVPKIGRIGGCYVLDGIVIRDSKVRLIRDNTVIYDGKLSSLKRFQDDVREVKAGFECGLSIDKYNDIAVNDIIEVYKIIETKRAYGDVE